MHSDLYVKCGPRHLPDGKRPLFRFSPQHVLAVKLTLFLICILCIQVSHAARSQLISVSVKNESFEKVMGIVRKQSGLAFISNKKFIKEARPVTVSLKEVPLMEALREIFEGQSFGFEVSDGIITVRQQVTHSLRKLPESMPADKILRTITGTVTDPGGETLPGVNILIKGVKTGTVTDARGKFTLEIPDENVVLVFSFVGYRQLEIPVANRNSFDLVMEVDTKALGEIVVTGYGTQRKKDLTGAITTIRTEDLLSVPAANIGEAMQGRAAGVTVVNEGLPGGKQRVRIRGFGTINNSDPLYVIDGVPTKQSLNTINPNDIESIQILKDASAASIYGSRAGNGVVVVTTKKGKIGTPKLTFDAYYGVQVVGNLPRTATPRQVADIEWALQRNAGIKPVHAQYGSGETPVLPDYIWPAGAMEGDPGTNPDTYQYNPVKVSSDDNPIARANKEGTDWMKEIFSAAPLTSYQLGAAGGTEMSRYAISLNYYGQQGTLIYTGFRRYSVRANTEYSFFNNHLKIGENLQYAYTENRGMMQESKNYGEDFQSQYSPISMALRQLRIIPVYDIMGNYAGSRAAGLGNSWNPVAQLDRQKDDRKKGNRVFGNVFAELNLLDGLTAKSSFGIDQLSNSSANFYFIRPEASGPGTTNSMMEYFENTMGWTWSNTLNYHKIIDNKHHMTFLAGTEAIQDVYRYFDGGRTDFYSIDTDFRYLSAGRSGLSNTGRGYASSLFSVFGRVDYGFNSRYLASLTIRRDGSSRFGTNHRYGAFPALSMGWVVSEEPFMKNIKVINHLKIRGGWGKTGNQEISNYASFSTYATSLSSTSYDLAGSNNSVTSGFALAAFGNPDLKWETSVSGNLGVDVSLLRNQLDVTLDVYHNITNDMLYPVPLPAMAGGGTAPFQNIGKMSNKGLDLSVEYRGKISETLTYDIGGNFSTYRNEVMRIDNSQGTFITGANTRPGTFTRIEKGHPVSAFYTYQTDGIFQNQQEVDAHAQQQGKRIGAFRLKDVNNDGVVNGDDQTWVGSPHPDFTYGLNLGLRYKNLDFTVFIQGSQGNDLVNVTKWFTDFDNFGGNRSVRMLDTWTPENPGASLPMLNKTMTQYDSKASTYYVEDGSYMRVKNLQVGYNFSPDLLKKLRMSNLRLYLQAYNLLTFTRYSGLDPEVYNTAIESMGLDHGIYPVTRAVNFGLNLSF